MTSILPLPPVDVDREPQPTEINIPSRFMPIGFQTTELIPSEQNIPSSFTIPPVILRLQFFMPDIVKHL
jgi:hypothetical protein